MEKTNTHRTFLVFFLVMIVAIMASCSSEKAQEEKTGNYQIMVVSRENKVLETNYAAIARGRQNVEIRPRVNGTITEICTREGAFVKKGEILFIIDQAPYVAALKTANANVKSAEAKLANARLTYEGKRILRQENIVSDFDLQTAHNALLEAEAFLEEAKARQSNAATDLSYTEIRSPVNGIASMIPYRVGALVDNNITEPLITVSDDEEVHVYFSMTENQMLDIIQRQGDLNMNEVTEIKFRLSNGNIYNHAGKIDAISGMIDYNVGTISIRATFPNPNKMLRNGGTGQVILAIQKKNCIVIPQSATYEIQNRLFVYKIVNGKTKSTSIEVESINDGKEYVVTSGLQEKDTIISEGAGLVREGIVVANK